MENHLIPVMNLKNTQRERGRTNIEVSDSGHGANGLLRSVIQGKGSVSGLELLTLLKKLLEPTILRLEGSEAKKPRSIFLMKLKALPQDAL